MEFGNEKTYDDIIHRIESTAYRDWLSNLIKQPHGATAQGTENYGSALLLYKRKNSLLLLGSIDHSKVGGSSFLKIIERCMGLKETVFPTTRMASAFLAPLYMKTMLQITKMPPQPQLSDPFSPLREGGYHGRKTVTVKKLAHEHGRMADILFKILMDTTHVTQKKLLAVMITAPFESNAHNATNITNNVGIMHFNFDASCTVAELAIQLRDATRLAPITNALSHIFKGNSAYVNGGNIRMNCDVVISAFRAHTLLPINIFVSPRHVRIYEGVYVGLFTKLPDDEGYTTNISITTDLIQNEERWCQMGYISPTQHVDEIATLPDVPGYL